MKKLITNLKKYWELIKKRKLLVIGILFVALIVINSLFYLFNGGGSNPNLNPDGVGNGQTVNGDNFDPKDPNLYENDSNSLFDNIPIENLDFSVTQLKSDEDGTPIIAVGLSNDAAREKFDLWLKVLVYPANTRFIYYTRPKV